ncbi:MAG: acyl-CoA dehydrogenase family protein [Dehalococcoidia bacterium]|jgi:alkylation response protein AidB-like acyl-CoA dehydrogenase|nr:acyl-CoA dehydrogenase family protein [Dehalococcoidia bacterium]
MIDFELPEAVGLVCENISRFVDERLLPLEQEVGFEDEEIPHERRIELRTELRDLGLLDLQRQEEDGGGGFGQRDMVAVAEEQGRAVIGADMWGAWRFPALLNRLPEESRKHYEELHEHDQLSGCLCLTEASSGSDPASMQTYFTRDGDSYVINGHKMFITGGQNADYATVYAREKGTTGREGINAFLVETSNPGFNVLRVIPTMGHPNSVATGAAEIVFEDMVVPAYARLSDEGGGWGMAQGTVGGVRFRMGARAVALAKRSLDMAVQYSKGRITFGEPLSERQGLQFMMADSYIAIQATRLLTQHGAWKLDKGMDARQEISVVKIQATEMLANVVDRAIQIHGGVGVTEDLPLERIFRNARIDRIVDGPNEIHRWVIARNLLRDRVVI